MSHHLEQLTTPMVASSAVTDPATSTRTLPVELWLLVLDHLDYAALHKASRSSKLFKSLIQDKRFDQILFRSCPPKQPVKLDTPVSIHPLLQATDCIFTGRRAIAFWDGTEHTAFEYPAVDEYATFPAFTTIELIVQSAVVVSDKAGVTVRRVLESLGDYWGAKPPAWFLDQQSELLDWIPRDEVTNQVLLYEHNGWTGWNAPAVRFGGRAVMLQAGPYDS
ncbi:hypothetical protein JCM9279_003505 [Rhodotorula babjevae]